MFCFDKAYTKWTKEDVLERLRQIAEIVGEMPTQSELNSMKESRLSNAIRHLGLNHHDLAVTLGLKPKQKPRGYWNEENVLNELREIIKERGDLSGPKQIQKDYPDLVGAIFRTRNWRYYKEKLGYQVKEQWHRDKVLERLKENIRHFGRVPTIAEINKHDRNLKAAIEGLREGYPNLLREIGEQHSQRDKGFWKVWENFADVVRPLCIDNKMPTVTMLKTTLGSSVGLAVADFGGVAEVAEKLGVKISPESYLTSKDGHALKSQYEVEFDDFLFDNGIKHEVECRITTTSQCRCDFKIGDVFVEIWGFNERINNKRCERYCQKRANKEKLYRDNHLKLISIEGAVFRKTKTSKHIIFRELLKEAGLS